MLKMKLLSLAVFVVIPFTECRQYPWLEQISRQEQLMIGCNNFNLKTKRKIHKSDLDHILVDRQHKLLYCYVPKVACTNWKRVYMVLTGESNATNLVDIPSDVAHAKNSTLRLSTLPKNEIKTLLTSYTLFLVTRHPFERILSAYRNKFQDTLPSSKYFQSRYGRYIIKKYRSKPNELDLKNGYNVTFSEFVRYLLDDGLMQNEHWIPIYNLCLPCALNYSFIGKYESISEDSKSLLELVGGPDINFPLTRSGHTRERLRYYLQQLSIFDIKSLYDVYKYDFKLFGYGLEDVLGYDLA